MDIKLYVGVIGLGMGKIHAQAIQKTEGACLYSVCDNDAETLSTVADELGVEHRYTDYRELLADPRIDSESCHSADC